MVGCCRCRRNIKHDEKLKFTKKVHKLPNFKPKQHRYNFYYYYQLYRKKSISPFLLLYPIDECNTIAIIQMAIYKADRKKI